MKCLSNAPEDKHKIEITMSTLQRARWGVGAVTKHTQGRSFKQNPLAITCFTQRLCLPSSSRTTINQTWLLTFSKH